MPVNQSGACSSSDVITSGGRKSETTMEDKVIVVVCGYPELHIHLRTFTKTGIHFATKLELPGRSPSHDTYSHLLCSEFHARMKSKQRDWFASFASGVNAPLETNTISVDKASSGFPRLKLWPQFNWWVTKQCCDTIAYNRLIGCSITIANCSCFVTFKLSLILLTLYYLALIFKYTAILTSVQVLFGGSGSWMNHSYEMDLSWISWFSSQNQFKWLLPKVNTCNNYYSVFLIQQEQCVLDSMIQSQVRAHWRRRLWQNFLFYVRYSFKIKV